MSIRPAAQVSKAPLVSRRRFLRGTLGATSLLLAGCEPLANHDWIKNTLGFGEWLNLGSQRLLVPRRALAPEYAEADVSSYFKPNGSSNPSDEQYRKLVESNFTDWRLEITGLVARPTALSLTSLRAMDSRTQITRHDCVEGWSCIGKWKGVPLGALLDSAGIHQDARYIVFHCLDTIEDPATKYYESIDLIDAFHPQTILAYEMNNKPLPVAHGAPLRLRVERQLGYKMAKYVTRIEAVASFAHLQGGKGGYWEDNGYEWYAGI
jgi:DMSO/TMAO reductase YedYZ molybdopterin-dependent catalytic subunit